jgi:FkbM family methyltransferase
VNLDSVLRHLALARLFTLSSLIHSGLLSHRRRRIQFPYVLSSRRGSDLSVLDSNQQFTFDEIFLKDEYKELREYVKLHPSCSIVDLGGNVGFFSFLVLAEYSSVTVHVFEPCTSNIKYLSDNVRNFGDRICIHQVAVSTRNGTADFYDDGDHGSIDINRFATSLVKQVPVVNFKDVLDGIRPNVIKMDIEGAELSILSDKSILAGLGCVSHITVEVHGSDLTELNVNVEHTAEMLSSEGFLCTFGRQFSDFARIVVAKK